jgi:ribonuclease VapC
MGLAEVIVDASAFLAILLDEPEGRVMEDILLFSPEKPVISPVNFLEAAVRVDRLGSPEKSKKFDDLMRELAIEILEVDREQALLAREAYQRFGKGRHPARFNLGDCFAYALAKTRGEPLLFKGDDFRKTDVEAAL